MVDISLVKTRFRNGVWEGVLTSPDETAPEVSLVHQGSDIGKAEVKPDPSRKGNWMVSVAVPAERLGDGVETFLLVTTDGDAPLARFAVAAGDALEEDLRAELDLMRGELDLLKRAFRRHCAESA